MGQGYGDSSATQDPGYFKIIYIYRYYLGTHRFVPNATVHIEMGQICLCLKRWLEIGCLYNRFCNMKANRLPKKVMQWEMLHGNKG